MDISELALRGVVALKGLNELVLLTLSGQGVLWLLAGSRRDTNLIYGALNVVGGRVLRFFRRLTPAFVLDRHIPLVAVFWLVSIELLLAGVKIYLVLTAIAPTSV